jgi:alpha-L-fucosidase
MLFRSALVTFLSLALATAQPQTPPQESAERTRWFREAKFGLFIHWGPYSVLGRHEWARHKLQIPQAQYDVYARAFNPVKFNADEWTDLAKAAGVRYLVITSKHHDGFSIYRSKVSDYDMEITPYRGDPLKDLATSARRKGLPLGFYHSIMDWHHPDYRPRRAWEYPTSYKEGGDFNAYIDFMKRQLEELLSNYGDVATIWFDGEWEHSVAETRSDEIYDFIRRLQPNTLINDRLYKRESGTRADFGTPEQFVPATGVKDPNGKPALWESCVTINADAWGYNKYETEFKTERDLIRMLVEVVSKGGNLLLNVGPRPDGTIQEEFVQRLRAIGRWMDRHGDAIYGTTASPFARLPFFGRATVKDSMLYLHVFDWPRDGRLRVPGLQNAVFKATLLGLPDSKLATERDGSDWIIRLPATAPDETASVIALQLDGAPQVTPYRDRPDESGVLHLGIASAEIETRFEQKAKKENILGHVYLTRWTRPDDVPTWNISIPKAGNYKVELTYAAARGKKGLPFAVTVKSLELPGLTQDTGDDQVFQPHAIGTLRLPAGEFALEVRSKAAPGVAAMNLEAVRLIPVK